MPRKDHRAVRQEMEDTKEDTMEDAVADKERTVGDVVVVVAAELRLQQRVH